MKKVIIQKKFHLTPKFLKDFFLANVDIFEKWGMLTLNSQDEWICWLTIAKKEETKKKRFERFLQDVKNNKKRPCCWPGCPHKNPSAQKYFSKNVI